MPLPLLALAAPSIIKAGAGIIQGIMGSKIHPTYTPYQTSQYAQQRLGLAQGLFNGRAAGAAAEERNIYNNNANTTNTIQRNATDSSQALALAGGVQTNTNDAFNNLGIEEDKNKYNLLDNLNKGYDAMTNEDHMKYQDMLNKYGIDTQQKSALTGAAISNVAGAASDFTSSMMQGQQQKDQNNFYKQYLGMAKGFN